MGEGMFPAPIDSYVRPESIPEAIAALAAYEDGEAHFIAGGQSLMQVIKARMVQPRCVIDLQSIEALRGIRPRQGAVSIGAMTRYVDIETDTRLDDAYGALRDAAMHVGDRQVRNRGTLGGSVCWNYLAACMPAVVLGLGASMQLVGAEGTIRDVIADDFLLGPLETARDVGEMLVAVNFNAAAGRSGSAYAKCGLVTDSLPVVGICVAVTLNTKGVCTDARVAFAGLANGAERNEVAEQHLHGSAGDDAVLSSAFAAAAENAAVHADAWADKRYRQQLIKTLGVKVGRQAFARARDQQ